MGLHQYSVGIISMGWLFRRCFAMFCVGVLLPFTALADVRVPVVVAQIKTIGAGFELDGVVQPVRQSTVSAQTAGTLVALSVKAGDAVRAGQLLATVDDRETKTGLQKSAAQLAQAQAELRNAQQNFDRTHSLQLQGFVSGAAMDSADSQLKAALAGRDQALAGDRQAGLSQGYTRVAAPFDAFVLQTHAEVGDLALPGKPLLTLYAPNPLRVVAQVPVSRSSQMNANSVIEVQIQAIDGSLRWIRPVQTGHVPTADPVSQTVEWRLELPSQAINGLMPGQQLRVRFAAGSSRQLVVPASAVLRRGELAAVYVAVNHGFVLKAVRLGADHGSQGVDVLAGLTDTDSVALDPVKAGLAGAQPAQPAASAR